MSYLSLMNNLCSWKRLPYNESSLDQFNEDTTEAVVMAEDVKCRLEKLYDRELIEMYKGGDHDKGIYVLYLPYGQNIRSSDVVTVLETVKLGGFGTVGIDGTYKRDKTQVNGRSIYELKDTNYRIYFDGAVWILKNNSTGVIMYKTTGDSLNTKNWVTVTGSTPVGKSVHYIIQDFHYNNTNEPNELLIMDIEDAGGGHRHHIQCFCRYREQIQ